jgi:hypothetical protein
MIERSQSEPAKREAGGPVNTTRCAEVLSLSPASTAEPEDQSGARAGSPSPQVKVLLVAERVDGFFLERLTDRGELVGETQHDTLDEAMWQAYSEYPAISEWRFCPDDADPLEYIRTHSRP